MKNFIFVTVLLLFGCSQNVEETFSEHEATQISIRSPKPGKNGWTAIYSDVAGGWGFGRMGLEIGGLFGPQGAVVGTMVGAVFGAVGGSLAYWYGKVNQDPSVGPIDIAEIGLPNLGEDNNQYCIIGKIHNEMMYEIIKNNLDYQDFDTVFTVFAEIVKKYPELDSLNITDDDKNWLHQVYLNSINPEFYHPQSLYLDSLKFETQSIISPTELDVYCQNRVNSATTIDQMAALSVLRHSYYFWTQIDF
jgi:hypothetical protein